MLVLTRKEGETLIIGNSIMLTVKEINSSHVKLCLNNSEDITIDKLESKVIADGIKIKVVKINKGQIKLGIDAPESMDIKREEGGMENE